MIQTCIRSEKLEHYNYHRTRLLDLCAKSDELLKKAQCAQKRHEAFSTPADKLKADTYTLVLIGAFQSGKSTLFNYLCDGRELSPVGPGGGGLRTSGCMVTAHPLPEGDKERAIITWRKPEELLSALGTTLIKYYDKPTSFTCLTSREVNLDNEADRRRLAELAVQELCKEGATLSNSEKELLRFTLVVCRFYNDFADSCKQGSTTCTPDEAVVLTSYPQDWANKWLTTQQEGSWYELPQFSSEEVNFAFCAGVELFLDSAILRDIGCSIIDCPGLFISKWDTEIAERCIREANAILYMFAGNKSLTQEDVEALKECVRLGGSHKMIFGANVRVSLDNWTRLLEQGVLPTLKLNGFDNPVVHNFHSAIALRSREWLYQQNNMLSESSQAAIEYDIQLTGKPMSVEAYLRKELNKYISTYTNFEESLQDYEDNCNALDKLSGVPAFVGAASNHVVQTRATSVLIHEGTRQLRASLTQAVAEMEQQIELLDKDVADARTILEEEQEKLRDFQRNRELHESAITRLCNEAIGQIYERFNADIDKLIQAKEEEIIKITKGHIPAAGQMKAADWWNKGIDIFNERFKTEILSNWRVEDRQDLSLKYAEKLGALLSEVLTQVKAEVERELPSSNAVRTLKDEFDSRRLSLMKQISSFKHVGSIAELTPVFPDDYSSSISAMAIPTATQLLQNTFSETDNFGEWIWNILTFGLKHFFFTRDAWAREISETFLPEFKKKTEDSLKNCMEQTNPDGPISVLRGTLGSFKSSFITAEKRIQSTLHEAEVLLNNAVHSADIIPVLKSISKDIDKVLVELEQMESDIRADFPSA